MFLNDWFWATDHPRVCGENPEMAVCYLDNGGSPPRVRGKQLNEAIARSDKRITPACAGKTALPCICISAHSDHPRVCGENLTSPASVLARYGSPPRVRGKPGHDHAICDRVRITPACAGKTHKKGENHGTATDHPRVCGENTSQRRS